MSQMTFSYPLLPDLDSTIVNQLGDDDLCQDPPESVIIESLIHLIVFEKEGH